MQGFHPQKHKAAKPKNYANGGIVKGPGTGTSDDVPAMVPKGGYVLPSDSVQALGFKPGMRAAQLSAGEAVLNPQQVQAAGGFQALDAMKSATHTPVPDQNMPGEKKFFFVNGTDGDELRKPFMPTLQPDVQRDMTKMYSASMPPRPQPAPAAVQPPAASGFVSSMERNQRALDVSTASGPATAAAKPVNPTEVEGWRTKAVMDGAAEDAQAAWDRGQVGQAAGAVARGAITAVPTAIGEFAYNTVAPVAGAAKGFWNGLTGGADSATQTPVTQAQAAPAAPPVTAPTAVRPAASPYASGQPEQPGTPAAQANAQAAGNVNVRRQPNGVMEFSGENIAGDVSYSGPAGFKPRGTVSAQNMAAADNLAQRSAARGFTPRSQETQPQGPQVAVMPNTGGYGLMDATRLRERELRMATTSTRSNLESSAGYKARMAGAAEALSKFQEEQTEGPRNAAERDLKAQELAMRGQEMQDARGFRSGQLANDSARLGLEGQRVGAEVKTRNIEAGQAERMQKLQDEYLNAKTPEAQASAVKKLQALAGKSPQSEWGIQVTPGMKNIDGSTTEASVYRYNKQTGQVERVDGGNQALPPMASNPKAMAIKDNSSMSIDQKRAALQALGYN